MNAKHIFIGTVVLMLLFSFGCLNSSKTTTTETQHTVAKTPPKTQNSGHTNKSMNGKGSKAGTNQTKQQSNHQNQNKQSEMNANHKGWKTYNDKMYGYTIKYPANWTVSMQESGALQIRSPFVRNRIVTCQIDCGLNTSANSAGELATYFKNMVVQYHHVHPTVENQTINGLTVPVISFDLGTPPSSESEMKEYVFWNAKNHVYCLAMVGNTPQTGNATYKLMQRIVETFQFQ